MNKNLSIRKMAKEIGISATYLCDILNGKKTCNYELIMAINQFRPNILIEKQTKVRYRVIGEEKE